MRMTLLPHNAVCRGKERASHSDRRVTALAVDQNQWLDISHKLFLQLTA